MTNNTPEEGQQVIPEEVLNRIEDDAIRYANTKDNSEWNVAKLAYMAGALDQLSPFNHLVEFIEEWLDKNYPFELSDGSRWASSANSLISEKRKIAASALKLGFSLVSLPSRTASSGLPWVKPEDREPFKPGRYYVEYSDNRKDMCFFNCKAWLSGPYRILRWLDDEPPSTDTPVVSEGPIWVKCCDRMPQLPDPLPPDTPDERGILFVNRKHSAAQFWFPSYGYTAEAQFPLEAEVDRKLYDIGWGREEWEWLDESAPLQKEVVSPVTESGGVRDKAIAFAEWIDVRTYVNVLKRIVSLNDKECGKWSLASVYQDTRIVTTAELYDIFSPPSVDLGDKPDRGKVKEFCRLAFDAARQTAYSVQFEDWWKFFDDSNMLPGQLPTPNTDNKQ